MLYISIGVAGFCGAIARFWLGNHIVKRTGSPFPWGTFLINVSGSFALGLLMGLGSGRMAMPPDFRLILGTGFLGAYTTFSTWQLETHRLINERSYLLAGIHVVLGTSLGLLSAAIGMATGKALVGVR